jgi:hypothetical protein
MGKKIRIKGKRAFEAATELARILKEIELNPKKKRGK